MGVGEGGARLFMLSLALAAEEGGASREKAGGLLVCHVRAFPTIVEHYRAIRGSGFTGFSDAARFGMVDAWGVWGGGCKYAISHDREARLKGIVDECEGSQRPATRIPGSASRRLAPPAGTRHQ